MRRARATSRIEEEEELQYILEDMAERNVAGEKNMTDDPKEKGMLFTKVVPGGDTVSSTPASSNFVMDVKNSDIDKKSLLTLPAKA
ncbi:hypothetical protein SK128_021617, partial [Halocaridina rubra]